MTTWAISAAPRARPVTFPEAQQADNDYAVGATLDMLAHSPYAGNTLVFVLEDDAQDGPDHMDAHRSTAYIVGPYVKKGAVVSTRYSTVNVVRTIEDILGLQHVNLNTAYQPSMDDVFNTSQSSSWTYTPTHTPAWWAHETRGFDFSSEDRVPANLFNEVLWKGLKGTPYPEDRSGQITRQDGRADTASAVTRVELRVWIGAVRLGPPHTDCLYRNSVEGL